MAYLGQDDNATLTKTGEGEYSLNVDAWGSWPFDLPDLSQIPLSDPGYRSEMMPGPPIQVQAPASGFPWWLLIVAGVLYAAHKAR